MFCGIYKIQFTGCDKVYIGQSINVTLRIKQHKKDLRLKRHGNRVLQMASDKYGLENMRVEIICYCDPSELDEKEIYYISHYNSYCDGFNKTIGGDSFSPKASRIMGYSQKKKNPKIASNSL